MEQSFKYYLENTFDSTRVELFKRYFKNEIELLPDRPCSYRIIYNICIVGNHESNQYTQSILNTVWRDYFKLKINGKLGDINNSKLEKIESKDDCLPIR